MSNKNILSEYNLAFNFINGNDEALGELYTLYYSSLMMVAYKYTQNTEKSKDIVGLVFEKLLNRWIKNVGLDIEKQIKSFNAEMTSTGSGASPYKFAN